MLIIKDLSVSIGQKQILQSVNLHIRPGEIHALMGPNGSGKSTLALACMGHPDYDISGNIAFNSLDITNFASDKRSREGLFLSFQSPLEIPGLSILNFLKEIYYLNTKKNIPFAEFKDLVFQKMRLLKLDPHFATRSLNEGFSGGEKKRLELLQMMLLNPKIAILDELDSGLDIDGIKTVMQTIVKIKHENPDMSLLIITHYPRMFSIIKPNAVHIMANGKILASGDCSLARHIEEKGYNAFTR